MNPRAAATPGAVGRRWSSAGRCAVALAVLGAFAGLCGAAHAAPDGAGTATAERLVLQAVEGHTTIGGRTAAVEILVARAPGADAALVAARSRTAARAAAEPPSDAFSLLGTIWSQFVDRGRGDDVVRQFYNPAGDPTPGVGLTALRNAQSTWGSVPGSSFRFAFGGTTNRCPSMVLWCAQPPHLDGYDDVGWGAIPDDDPAFVILGIAFLVGDAFTGATHEADVLLNHDVSPLSWVTEGSGCCDLESVVLHELGHVAGLGHTEDASAVMYGFPAEAPTRVLTSTDADGLRALYPTKPSIVTDTPSAHDFAVVAEMGDTAPGGGVLSGAFEPGAVNVHGDVAFVADVTEGQGLVLARRSGRLEEIVRSGEVAAGLTLGAGSASSVSVNDAGDVAFSWFVGPVVPPFGLGAALFRTDASGTTSALVVPYETPAPGGGVFVGSVDASLARDGAVAFLGLVESGAEQAFGVYVARRDGSIDLVARPGMPAPGAGTFTALVGVPSMSASGHVAFAARTNAAPGPGVYLRRRGEQTLTAVARPGDPAPGGSFTDAARPTVNDRGDVAFGGIVPRPGSPANRGVYVARAAGPITTVAAPDDVLPDGWRFNFLLDRPRIDQRGDVAFSAVTARRDTDDPFLWTDAVYASSDGRLRPVLHAADVLHGLGWIWFAAPVPQSLMSDRGEVVFPVLTVVGRHALLRAGTKAG
jgi:hypothetical protein